MRSPLLASVLALPLALSTAACASSGGLEARSAADADASPEAAAEPQAEVDVAGAAGEGLKTATYTTAAAFILVGKVVGASAVAVGSTVGSLFSEGPSGAAAAWEKGARRARVVARREARYTAETADEGAAATRGEAGRQ
jgi:hypothetical protein